MGVFHTSLCTMRMHMHGSRSTAGHRPAVSGSTAYIMRACPRSSSCTSARRCGTPTLTGTSQRWPAGPIITPSGRWTTWWVNSWQSPGDAEPLRTHLHHPLSANAPTHLRHSYLIGHVCMACPCMACMHVRRLTPFLHYCTYRPHRRGSSWRPA